MKKLLKCKDLVYYSLICIFAFAFMMSCSSAPLKNEILERAQLSYEQAKANMEILSNSRVEMHEAEKAVQEALEAHRQEDENVHHLSYIADRLVQIAIAKAEQRIAEKQINFLSKQKQKVLLETRQKEAEMALKKAEEKEREIEAKAKELELKAKEIQLAHEQKRQLERELSELQAKQTDRGLVLTIGDVLFAPGRAELSHGSVRSINKLANFLNRHSDRDVIIEGHTDGQGSQDYNRVLSQQRADNVRVALLERDVDPRRIITKGYGKLYPIATNSTPEGRQQNRRVEIIILNKGTDGRSMLR